MSDIAGEPAAILVRQSVGFDRQTGKFIQKTWRGSDDAINAVEASISGVDSYIKDPEGNGVWTLTARWSAFTEEGTTEVPTKEERLRFNIHQKSIYSNPQFSALTSDEINEVRKAVDDKSGSVGFVGTNADLMFELYSIATAGVDSTFIYQPTVVVSSIASADYPWDIEFADYGKIFTTAGMIADAALESGWKANLPNGTSDNANFIYGWLKSPPEIVSVGANQTQLVQEYVYGLWAAALYATA